MTKQPATLEQGDIPLGDRENMVFMGTSVAAGRGQAVVVATGKFQIEDCQRTSLPAEAFDTAFMSLAIHFTDPEKTLAEMRRILKPGGTLIISNHDVDALRGLDLIRCWIRVIYRGLTGYRMKPPKGFGNNVMSEKQLCDLLGKFKFEILSAEAIKDTSRSSHIPVEYIKAVKV